MGRDRMSGTEYIVPTPGWKSHRIDGPIKGVFPGGRAQRELCDSTDLRQTLVQDAPKHFDRLWPAIEEVLEEPRTVQQWRIGVPLAIVTVFRFPVTGFAGVEYLE